MATEVSHQTTEASSSSHLGINPHRALRFDPLVLDNTSSLTDRGAGGWIYNNNQELLNRLPRHGRNIIGRGPTLDVRI